MSDKLDIKDLAMPSAAKIIAEKTFGAIKHKLEKDKIVRQKELDHAANTDVQSLKSSESSLKDEYLSKKKK